MSYRTTAPNERGIMTAVYDREPQNGYESLGGSTLARRTLQARGFATPRSSPPPALRPDRRARQGAAPVIRTVDRRSVALATRAALRKPGTGSVRIHTAPRQIVSPAPAIPASAVPAPAPMAPLPIAAPTAAPSAAVPAPFPIIPIAPPSTEDWNGTIEPMINASQEQAPAPSKPSVPWVWAAAAAAGGLFWWWTSKRKRK